MHTLMYPHMWVWTLVYRSCYGHAEETLFSLSDSAALGYILSHSQMNSFQLSLLSLLHVSVSQWFLFPLCSIFSYKHLITLYLATLWLSSSLGIKVLFLSLKGLKPQTEIRELSAFFLWFVWFKAKEEDGLRKVVCWRLFCFLNCTSPPPPSPPTDPLWIIVFFLSAWRLKSRSL